MQLIVPRYQAKVAQRPLLTGALTSAVSFIDETITHSVSNAEDRFYSGLVIALRSRLWTKRA